MKHSVRTSIITTHVCRTVCVLLVLATLFLMFAGECHVAQIYECLSDVNAAVREQYIAQQRLLTDYTRVSNLQNGIDPQSAAAPVSLLFLVTDRTLTDNAYPLVSGYGFTGAFVLTGDTMIGGDDGPSASELDALISDGWCAVLGGDGGADISAESGAVALDRYLTDTLARLTAQGLPAPQTYYLEHPDICDECLDVLRRHGITTIIQGADPALQKNRFTGCWRGGIYFCGSSALHNLTSHVQESVYNAGLQSGAMTVTVRRVTDNEAGTASGTVSDTASPDPLDCTAEKLLLCLDWFAEDSRTYGFHVTGLDGLRAQKQLTYERILELTAGYNTPDDYLSDTAQRLSEIGTNIAQLITAAYEPVSHGFSWGSFFDFLAAHTPGEIFGLIRGYRSNRRFYG